MVLSVVLWFFSWFFFHDAIVVKVNKVYKVSRRFYMIRYDIEVLDEIIGSV